MKLGLIGHPVAHSLSPKLHTFLLRQLGFLGTYQAWDTPPDAVENRLTSLWQAGVAGLNVTVPHKEAVLAYVTSQSPTVASIGAANTLVRTPNGWHAQNTDISGFWASLPLPTQQSIQHGPVWLLGAGGSAKSLVAALCQHSASALVIISRSSAKAQPLLDWIETTHPTVAARWRPWGKAPEGDEAPPALIINATSVGLCDTDDATAFDWLWQNNNLTHTAAMDLIYRSATPTAFVTAAQQGHCCNVFDGLSMLVHQGADALTLWTGQDIPQQLRQEALIHLQNNLGVAT
jgi:shikimate dehydrogenase